MPPRKPAPKPPTAPTHAPYAPLFMVVIVALLTIALLLVWRELPTGSKPLPEAPIGDVKPVPAASTSTEQVACEAARGKWVECGNPCHGKPGDVCITKCEPQCLCGGIAGWMCPKDLTCTDYVPEAGVPDALGVCRAKPVVVVPTGVLTAGMICDDLSFICVDEEVKGSTLNNPFVVTGSGFAFENTINWRVLDGNERLLVEGFTTATATAEVGMLGDFEIRAFMLQVPTTPTGTLEIFEYSAKDGSPIHVVRIPVKLPQSTMTVKVYGASRNECETGGPITLVVPFSSLPIEATLRAQLLDPGRTNIPMGTKLESLSVSKGTATVIYSPELENYGGGSCYVQAIRSQIETTLKQFSSIKNVVISVVGKTAAETLQP